MMRLGTTALVLTLLAGPAQAGVLEDCTQKDDWWLRITACTSAIEGGKWPGARAAWAYSNRAVAHGALGMYIQAFDDHEKAVKLDPSNANARNNKANSHAAFREYDRALAEYTAAIRLKPGNIAAHFNRAGIYVALGQDKAARDDYSVVIAAKPDLGAAYAGRAEAACRLGESPASVADRNTPVKLGALSEPRVEAHLRETGYLKVEAPSPEERDRALFAWTEAGCP